MEFVSTRDTTRRVSAAQAIAAGISPDGGLYSPVSFPALTADEWAALRKMDYKARVAFVLGKYLTDFDAQELSAFTAQAYAADKFGGDNTAPVVALKDGKYMLELWHGPTCAFKDMALQMLPHLLTAAMKKTGEKRTACILVATSGDTGTAALNGFADVAGTKIMVYYPVDGVSQMQKLQMTTQEGKNVAVCAIRGNFDDAQSAVKRIFTDEATLNKLSDQGLTLSSANSINFGRLAPQIAYYISAYCDLVNQGEIKDGDKVNFCVPTGNFGNILAGYFAKQMGLPVNRFICASNQNNVLTDFFASGTYDRNRAFYATASPSMDILISSNLERLLFYACGKNDKEVAQMMQDLAAQGKYQVSKAVFDKLSQEFFAGCADDTQTAQTIKKLFTQENYLADTHTAVAVHVYEEYCARTKDQTPTIIVSTASPFKFGSSVIPALGGTVKQDGPDLLAQLTEMTKVPAPAPLAALANRKPRFDMVVDKEEILGTTDLLKTL